MRDHSNHITMTRHQAVAALMERWEYTRRTETLPVEQALGRVAAEDVKSQVTLPSWPTSNMDGVAVHFADFEGGAPDTANWQRGVDWQFCNTGIAMPEGFDTAIAIECVELSENDTRIKLNHVPEHAGESTSPVGSRLGAGDVLVRAGEPITPVLQAVLSMGGHTHVQVVARPRVAFIPTGNELVPTCANPPVGKNIETNAIMVCGKLAQWGAEPSRFPIVPDKPDLLLSAMRRAAAECDIVVMNAGSSKGSDDYTCELLEREGEVLCHQTDQGPGRHVSMSLLDGTPVVGISGPPVGAEFTTDWFVKPFVDAYLGLPQVTPPVVQAVMRGGFAARVPRPMNLVRRVVVSRLADGTYEARPMSTGELPELRCCNAANGTVTVPKDSAGWNDGDTLEVELRWPYRIPE